MDVSASCRRILQLSCVPGLGLKSFYAIYERVGSIDHLFASSGGDGFEGRVAKKTRNGVQSLLSGKISPEIDRYEKRVDDWLSESPKRRLICIEDESYPSYLKEIPFSPPLLYLEGELSCLSMPSIAIVGSRKPSIKALRHAQTFSAELASHGLCIVSGLALGIDAAGHRGALESGASTIGVLATGLDQLYPKQNISLARCIADSNGLLVSEMKLGTRARPGNFPRRNRLVSGLSRGVLVVEAAEKSGSLITARYALEQDREVFAVPGQIDNPLARGCHQLIKAGAKLVENVDDIIEEFHNPLSCFGARESSFDEANSPLGSNSDPGCSVAARLDQSDREMLVRMGSETVSFDDLLSIKNVAPEKLLLELMDLELNGYIDTVPGGYRRSKSVESVLAKCQ